MYWDNSRDGESRSVHEAFPDVDWEKDQRGLMEQVIAINEKLTDRPKKVFWEKKTVVRGCR